MFIKFINARPFCFKSRTLFCTRCVLVEMAVSVKPKIIPEYSTFIIVYITYTCVFYFIFRCVVEEYDKSLLSVVGKYCDCMRFFLRIDIIIVTGSICYCGGWVGGEMCNCLLLVQVE